MSPKEKKIQGVRIFAKRFGGQEKSQRAAEKIGGMEFYDVHFSYLDNQTLMEEFVAVPEQGVGKLIPEGMNKPGHIYTVSHGDSGMIGVYKIETEVVPGSGKFDKTGLGSYREAKESIATAFARGNYGRQNRPTIIS